jgi:hypothetical protein
LKFPGISGLIKGIIKKLIKNIISDMKLEGEIEKYEKLKKGESLKLTGFKRILADIFISAGIVDAGEYLKDHMPLVALHIMDKVVEDLAKGKGGAGKVTSEELDGFFSESMGALRQSGELSPFAGGGAKAIKPSGFIKGALFAAGQWMQDTAPATVKPKPSIFQQKVPGSVEVGDKKDIEKAQKAMPGEFYFFVYRDPKDPDKLYRQKAIMKNGKKVLEAPEVVTVSEAMEAPPGYKPFKPPWSP